MQWTLKCICDKITVLLLPSPSNGGEGESLDILSRVDLGPEANYYKVDFLFYLGSWISEAEWITKSPLHGGGERLP